MHAWWHGCQLREGRISFSCQLLGSEHQIPHLARHENPHRCCRTVIDSILRLVLERLLVLFTVCDMGIAVKIVLYIIWVLFAAGAAAASIHSLRKTQAQERLIDSWPKAQATVTGSRQGWTSGAGNASRNQRYWPRYEFTGPQGVLYLGESEVSRVERPVPGSVLEVAYNPENPAESFEVAHPSKVVLAA